MISFEDLCGEEDLRSPRLKEGRLWAGKAGAIRSKKVDMLWIWELFGFVISIGS